MHSARKIRPSVLQALTGADYVKAALLSLLQTGPDSVGSSAYAIKCRVKSEESLTEKIQVKRRKRPTYSADDVTDIVGLRLLALTSEHLPIMCEKFIAFIIFCQQTEISLFQGRSLREAIQEIKVYKSSANPLVYDKVHLYFKSLNIDQNKISLNESDDQDPYSSVHIVCSANSFYGKSPKIIPVEVQIRTVFEDAWSEIDHPLRYKGIGYLKQVKSKQFEALKKNADSFLGPLKDNVDLCLKYADKIKTLHDIISDGINQRAPAIQYTPLGPRLSYRRISGQVSGGLREIDKQIEDLEKTKNTTEVNKELDRLIGRLSKVVDSLHPPTKENDREALFLAKMDMALLMIWKSRNLTKGKTLSIEAHELIKRATEIYLELDADGRYAREAVLKYRLASALLASGTFDGVLENLKQAVALLPKDSRIPRNHLLQISIRRQCSYAYWRTKQTIWAQCLELGNLKYRAVEQTDNLSKALYLIEDCASRIPSVDVSDEKSVEELRVWNNYICFVWDIRKLGVPRDVTEEQKTQIIRTVDEIEGKLSKYARKLTGLDTVAKGAALVGDKKRLKKVLRLLMSEWRIQSGAKSATDGYTKQELEYVSYCINELRNS